MSPKRTTEAFVLTVHRNDDNDVRKLSLAGTNHAGVSISLDVNGKRAPLIAAQVWSVLHQGGVTPKKWQGTKPIELDNTTGAHLQLLLRVIRPVRRADRIKQLADAVAAMPSEEALYWHARADRPGGLPALRTLLQGGVA